jgi:hypothetical protein
LNGRRLAAQKIVETAIFGALALPSAAGESNKIKSTRNRLGKNGLIDLQGDIARVPCHELADLCRMTDALDATLWLDERIASMVTIAASTAQTLRK